VVTLNTDTEYHTVDGYKFIQFYAQKYQSSNWALTTSYRSYLKKILKGFAVVLLLTFKTLFTGQKVGSRYVYTLDPDRVSILNFPVPNTVRNTIIILRK
jgi:hypothetical protein